MVFKSEFEPKVGQKVNLIHVTNFYDTNGVQQKDFPREKRVTVFEVEKINNQIFYRIGGQNQWIPKSATDFKNEKLKGYTDGKAKNKKELLPSIQPAPRYPDKQKNVADNYNFALKDGLGIQKYSKIPKTNEIRNLFKEGKKFPKDTEFEWIKKPDTKQNKYTNAKVKIIFSDGSYREHSVHYKILPLPKISPADNSKDETEVKNQVPKDLKFNFVNESPLLKSFVINVDEALKLYEEAYYPQMSNTIRQAVEILTDLLLKINHIVPGPGWNNSNLNNQLAYIAYLKVLPQRIINLCFNLKNYGNIGSHHNKMNFTQASALTVLQQYHDLLAYLVNTYEGKNIPFADVLITDEKHKHKAWYEKPQIDDNYLDFQSYLDQKNHPKPEPVVVPKQVNEIQTVNHSDKTSPFMKSIFIALGIIGFAIVLGIAYEIRQLNSNETETTQVNSENSSFKKQASNLSLKQTVALSIIYADMKLDDQWQSAYAEVINNEYRINRYSSYDFGNAAVSAKGNNYIYVLEKNVGFGFQDKSNGKRLVTFFDPDQKDPENNPVNIYAFQMLKQIKEAGNLSKINSLAKKIYFINND